MYVADTVSQAYLPNADTSVFVQFGEYRPYHLHIIECRASTTTETCITWWPSVEKTKKNYTTWVAWEQSRITWTVTRLVKELKNTRVQLQSAYKVMLQAFITQTTIWWLWQWEG